MYFVMNEWETIQCYPKLTEIGYILHIQRYFLEQTVSIDWKRKCKLQDGLWSAGILTAKAYKVLISFKFFKKPHVW